MLLDIHSEVYAWIRGGIFILFVYHFLIYLHNRNKLYLYFSLYLGAMTLFLCKSIFSETTSLYYEYIDFPVQCLAYAAYIEFGRVLLDSKKALPIWDRYLKISIRVLLIFSPIFIIVQALFGYQAQVKVFVVLAPTVSVFMLYFFYIIIKKIKDSSGLNFIIATLFYLVLANVTFLDLFIGTEPFSNLGVNSEFFLYLGVIIQCLILAAIIGSIIQGIEQKSKNAELNLALKSKEMEELKMTALQSQMNPHFLFNSLNSINNFVLKNDIEKASDYITKFSRLIRVILNNSSSSTSTLAEELGILALYVKLEQIRVTGGFTYRVNVEDNLNLEPIKVPPLFLQPFIENAIWHGITKKEGDKLIELTIKKEGDRVICTIVDNGIGINKAKELEHMSQKKKFFGAKATENRIRILYQNKDVHIETKDISSRNGTGTMVLISFPLP